MKTYAITHDQLAQLAEAMQLLDWMKNSLSDASPDKREAAISANQGHALIATVLGEDDHLIYGPTEQEQAA